MRKIVAPLPETGFVRLPAILSVFPVSKSTWWQGVRTGRYPKSVKLSARATGWNVQAIRELIARTAVSDAALGINHAKK